MIQRLIKTKCMCKNVISKKKIEKHKIIHNIQCLEQQVSIECHLKASTLIMEFFIRQLSHCQLTHIVKRLSFLLTFPFPRCHAPPYVVMFSQAVMSPPTPPDWHACSPVSHCASLLDCCVLSLNSLSLFL